MPSYCEEQYIHSLEKKVEEQKAMIDWLSLELSKMGNKIPFTCPSRKYKPIMECVSEYGSCANCWKEAAQETIRSQRCEK